ncbi:hypothetical protein BIY27_25665 [Gibbsiella quercinecans]|uniref:hypothetical protein n=1 Tax=Gibbsiella quercinecans TaxID=929813 RepID=UPI000EF24943|nr:hypothetical protein [Gibbsiella quercinecans]RLM02152.1 hypothetical protein BIY27_25665 [Gibbsiella quercinecans]
MHISNQFTKNVIVGESFYNTSIANKTGNLEHFLFSLAIFLYPFSIASHTLYLVPQALLIALSATSMSKKLYLIDALAFLFGVVAFLITFAVEFTANNPNWDLSSKLIVNTISIMLIAGTQRLKFSEVTLWYLRNMCLVWIVVAIFAYYKSGVTSLSAFMIIFNSGSEIASSSLYAFAEPIKQFYLTKNITAMFIVSVFSLYLYIAYSLKKKVTFAEFLLFFFASTIFLSRQSIITIIALYGFYLFLKAGYLSKLLVTIPFIAVGSIFFSKFFDLKSSNDGASQRLELWKYFFDHCQDFFFSGNGVSLLNYTLRRNIGIDNFHMFFMNQIGAYGIVHFITFSLFLYFIFIRPGSKKPRLILVAGYFLNVCFQTYGYEFGNLFLFMSIYPLIDNEKRAPKRLIPKIKLKLR